MKELMELIKQKMMLTATSIDRESSPEEDQCASKACLILAMTYKILYFLDKKETAEPIATIDPNSEVIEVTKEENENV